MLTLNNKPKVSQRKERNDDLSILTSIQRFKKPAPLKISSRSNQQSQFLSGQNIKSQYGKNSQHEQITWGKNLANSDTRSITMSCVPKLVSTANNNSLWSTHTHSEPQASSSSSAVLFTPTNRSNATRPVSRNLRSRWSVYSSDTITRNQPSSSSYLDNARQLMSDSNSLSVVPEIMPEEPAKTPFPLWFQDMVKLPPGSTKVDTPWNSRSSSVGGKKSINNNNLLVQSSWIIRNSDTNALSDPKITSKYSIAELLDVLCGKATLPEKGLFIGLENAMDGRTPQSSVTNPKRFSIDTSGSNSNISRTPYEFEYKNKEKKRNRSNYFGDLDLGIIPTSTCELNSKENKRRRSGFFEDLDQDVIIETDTCEFKSNSKENNRSQSGFFGDLGIIQTDTCEILAKENNRSQPHYFEKDLNPSQANSIIPMRLENSMTLSMSDNNTLGPNVENPISFLTDSNNSQASAYDFEFQEKNKENNTRNECDFFGDLGIIQTDISTCEITVSNSQQEYERSQSHYFSSALPTQANVFTPMRFNNANFQF